MDALLLSRLQFAATTMFHFLFVPLTLGLSFVVAYMESQYVKTGDETYLRMTKFWGKLFLINFAVGVVTGITLEFQFGTNWSRYSAYVGDPHRGLDFRLEKAVQKGACYRHVDSRHRLQHVSRLDSGGQRLDAEPGRIHHSKRSGRTNGFRCRGFPEVCHR